MTSTTLRLRACAAALLVLTVSACSNSDSEPRADTASSALPAASGSPSDPSAGASPSSAAAGAPGAAGGGTPTSVPAPGTTTTGVPSQTSPTPVSSRPPGPQAQRRSAAPGRYTMDVKGSIRTETGEQPTNGEATLTVDPPVGDDQHSVLAAGQSGSSEQTVRFTPSAIQLVQLKISSPGFTKEFRPVQPVLLLPQPPTVGRSWSWTIVSTDGATTAAVTAKITGTETIVVGGERVATTVVHATLKLSGDINATTVMDTWYADRYHLRAKEHAVTDGQFQGIAFHSETTTTLRSTNPA